MSSDLPLPDRKPDGMSWESFTEHRIREAQRNGQFDNLKGAGQPIPGIDAPPAEDWWLKQKLKDEGLSVLPPMLVAKQALADTLASLPGLTSEDEVRRRLLTVNQIIRDAIASLHPSPPIVVLPVDVEQQVARWKQTRPTLP